MKLLSTIAVAALLVCSSGVSFAQSKAVREQNDHARNVQRANEARRVQNNNSVNRNAQQQRYNATRPSSPPPSSYNNRRK